MAKKPEPKPKPEKANEPWPDVVYIHPKVQDAVRNLTYGMRRGVPTR